MNRDAAPVRSSAEADLALREEIALSELVNRVLDRGVVVTGEVMISVGGVDLVYLGLDLLLTSVETMRTAGGSPGPAAGAARETGR